MKVPINNGPDQQRLDIEARIGAIGWGAFFLWCGIALWADLGWGVGLLGVGVANPRHVRDFATSTGQLAKTDRLHARTSHDADCDDALEHRVGADQLTRELLTSKTVAIALGYRPTQRSRREQETRP